MKLPGWLSFKKIGNMSDLIRRVFWEETGVILVEAEGNKVWPSRGGDKAEECGKMVNVFR